MPTKQNNIKLNNRNMKNRIHIFFALILPLLIGCTQPKMYDADKLSGLVANAQPGDTIVVRNGVYNDVELKFYGKGKNGNPIVVIAEEPGKVIFAGKSNLRLAGEYIEVNGLCFRNGYSPKGAVIEFRNEENVANNCRITNCAIYYFNPDDRSEKNNWVLLYGRNNHFDHNSLVGKLNPDVTLAVILDEERNCENNHLIAYNYFADRPVLGSNGGETMRIGTSHHAFFSSNTQVRNNIFKNCDGEVEVLSVKSSDNIVVNNLFLECSGVLALRHGNRNRVENNAFIGNEKPNTGGIRVVNEGHTIKGNIFYRLKGTRFFGALGLMNAVPNSLPNRYHHVKDVVVEDNQFIECDNIYWGVGADSERTEAPSDIIIRNNTFYHTQSRPVYTVCSDISGYTFENNRYNYPGSYKLFGFDKDNTLNNIKPQINYVDPQEVGVNYPLEKPEELTGQGRRIEVSCNDLEKIKFQANDTVVFTDTAYYLKNTIRVNVPLVMMSSELLSQRSLLRFDGDSRAAFITLVNGGSLNIKGISFDGNILPGKAQAIGAIESQQGMITPYELFVDNCEFYGFNESGFAAIRGRKSTFAPHITIANSVFREMSGEAINLADEKDDKGIYNVENLTIRNCQFERLLGAALNIYRGGNDESTSGPFVCIDNCRFHTVNNKEQGSVLRLIGAQKVRINDCEFIRSGQGGAAIRFDEMRWDDIELSRINLWESGRISTFWNQIKKNNITNRKPLNTEL